MYASSFFHDLGTIFLITDAASNLKKLRKRCFFTAISTGGAFLILKKYLGSWLETGAMNFSIFCIPDRTSNIELFEMVLRAIIDQKLFLYFLNDLFLYFNI